MLVAMLVLVAVGMVLGRGSSQAAGSARPAVRTITVQSGESLWSVAARIAPHSDPRLVVADLRSRNGLAGDRLVAGQQLVLPTSVR